jgi:hypothetical protein
MPLMEPLTRAKQFVEPLYGHVGGESAEYLLNELVEPVPAKNRSPSREGARTATRMRHRPLVRDSPVPLRKARRDPQHRRGAWIGSREYRNRSQAVALYRHPVLVDKPFLALIAQQRPRGFRVLPYTAHDAVVCYDILRGVARAVGGGPRRLSRPRAGAFTATATGVESRLTTIAVAGPWRIASRAYVRPHPRVEEADGSEPSSRGGLPGHLHRSARSCSASRSRRIHSSDPAMLTSSATRTTLFVGRRKRPDRRRARLRLVAPGTSHPDRDHAGISSLRSVRTSDDAWRDRSRFQADTFPTIATPILRLASAPSRCGRHCASSGYSPGIWRV